MLLKIKSSEFRKTGLVVYDINDYKTQEDGVKDIVDWFNNIVSSTINIDGVEMQSSGLISFEGEEGSGKTTLIKGIENEANKFEIKVQISNFFCKKNQLLRSSVKEAIKEVEKGNFYPYIQLMPRIITRSKTMVENLNFYNNRFIIFERSVVSCLYYFYKHIGKLKTVNPNKELTLFDYASAMNKRIPFRKLERNGLINVSDLYEYIPNKIHVLETAWEFMRNADPYMIYCKPKML